MIIRQLKFNGQIILESAESSHVEDTAADLLREAASKEEDVELKVEVINAETGELMNVWHYCPECDKVYVEKCICSHLLNMPSCGINPDDYNAEQYTLIVLSEDYFGRAIEIRVGIHITMLGNNSPQKLRELFLDRQPSLHSLVDKFYKGFDLVRIIPPIDDFMSIIYIVLRYGDDNSNPYTNYSKTEVYEKSFVDCSFHEVRKDVMEFIDGLV